MTRYRRTIAAILAMWALAGCRGYWDYNRDHGYNGYYYTCPYGGCDNHGDHHDHHSHGDRK